MNGRIVLVFQVGDPHETKPLFILDPRVVHFAVCDGEEVYQAAEAAVSMVEGELVGKVECCRELQLDEGIDPFIDGVRCHFFICVVAEYDEEHEDLVAVDEHTTTGGSELFELALAVARSSWQQLDGRNDRQQFIQSNAA